MMRNILWVAACIPLFVASGCGKSSDIALSEAGGTVTFKGAPVVGANIAFIPDSGPVAMGTTDAQGKFTLSTGAEKGAKVGTCAVSVDLPQPDAEVITDTMELTKMMGEGKFSGKSAKKSMLPEKYSKKETSGLTFTVDSDSSKNNFVIELN